MAVDRVAAVKKAEELVREGKIELAIEAYVRLVEDLPGDAGAANALGDLYVRVGNRAAAAAQFTQIGDFHRDSGFVPKAVAFYKKALKAEPSSDHALSQLAAIASEQQLFADATLYLNRLLQRRREQHNEAGVAECLARLGGFPTATADAKLAAARASATHIGAEQAVRLWVDAADALDRAGRGREVVDVLMQAASLQPDDAVLRRRVAVACAASGQIDRARAFLSFETAGDHPDLLLALAGHALADGREADARRALDHVIEVAPDRRAEADAMLAPFVAENAPAPAAPDVPADGFTVDVDAVPEPSPAPEPESRGDTDDAVYVAPDDEPAAIEEAPSEPEFAPAASAPEIVETVQIVEIVEPVVESVVPDWEAAEPVDVAAPIETEDQGPSQSDLDSIAALTQAAQNPSLQFQAAAQLGRLLLRLGRAREGIDWLERATQAATSVREQRLDVMYELADALERAGDRARALDVFADLDFDAASFRDVPERMAALRHGLGEGRPT